MAKKLLFTFDVATVSKVLNHEIPNLFIDSISIIETGWDHLVAEVNGEWIFRFPRTKGSIANQERERDLLGYLKNHLSLSIPDFHYLGKETAFVGYQKIRGIHLNKQIYTSLDLKVRKHIAKSIASFFTELHQAVSIDQARQWGYAPIIRPLLEIELELLCTLPREIATMINDAVSYACLDLSRGQVFCHQDVNGDNMAWDETTRQINGVFDFSDTGIGHYSLDFAELFVIDAELAILTAEIYAQMNNVVNPLMGGASDYVLRKATWIVLGRKNPVPQSENELLEGLRDFLPIWHDVVSRTVIV
ncbi:MAG: aminoglycoside phosphotransferase family protein [Legionella sp.]|nr:aminoglycoside phosphotransferase family protein [Legionella sp.]